MGIIKHFKDYDDDYDSLDEYESNLHNHWKKEKTMHARPLDSDELRQLSLERENNIKIERIKQDAPGPCQKCDHLEVEDDGDVYLMCRLTHYNCDDAVKVCLIAGDRV